MNTMDYVLLNLQVKAKSPHLGDLSESNNLLWQRNALFRFRYFFIEFSVTRNS